MGIKDLNKFVQQVGHPIKKKIDFKTIIIDGNNLLISYLSKSYSSIKSKNYDLFKQLENMISSTIQCIKNLIYSLKRRYKDVDIIIVFDPIKTPIYRIEKDESETIEENKNESKDEDKPFKELDLKKETQNKRRERMNNSKVQNLIEQIKFETGENFEESEPLIQCVEQMFYYSDMSNILKLTDLIKNILNSELVNLGIYSIQSISEADLVIKYISSISFKPCLVMSKDTDYFVLLSDIKNVYKSELSTDSNIYYPLKLWKKINLNPLEFEDLKKIFLISSMTGNDYNVQTSLIKPDKDIYLKILKDNIDPSDFNKRTNIYKFLIKNNVDSYKTLKDSLLSLKLYKNSFEVYLNWDINHDYVLLNNTSEDELNILLQNYINNIILKAFPKVYTFNFKLNTFDNYLDSFSNIKESLFSKNVKEIINFEIEEFLNDDKILIEDD
jgi:hypothetical protein